MSHVKRKKHVRQKHLYKSSGTFKFIVPQEVYVLWKNISNIRRICTDVKQFFLIDLESNS